MSVTIAQALANAPAGTNPYTQAKQALQDYIYPQLPRAFYDLLIFISVCFAM